MRMRGWSVRWSYSGGALLLSTVAVVAACAALFALCAPADAQTPPPAVGDWVVSDTTVVAGQYVLLQGNLLVTSTGSLTLEDVDLRLNCTFNGALNITVEPGGELVLRDTDHDPATTDDATTVASLNWGFHYNWFCRPGSRLLISASEVRDCGVAVQYQRGLIIETDDARLENSTFTECNYGIYLRGASPVIEDCVIVDNFGYGMYIFQSAARVDRCVLRNNFDAGAWIVSAQGLVFRNCTFEDHEWAGMNATNSRVSFEDCTFRNNSIYGARFYSSCQGLFVRNNVTGGGYCGVYLGSDCPITFRDCSVTDVDGRGVWMYRSRTQALRIHVSNCSEGMFIYGSEAFPNAVQLDLSTIEGSELNGVTVSDSDDFSIVNCTIADNGNNGVYVGSLWTGDSTGGVGGCDIRGNKRAGIYVQDGSRCHISSTDFADNGIYAIYCDGRSIVDWYEPGTRVIQDQSFRVRGFTALTVMGDLTLVNVTLAVNITEGFVTPIVVRGALRLLDSDGSRYTTFDATSVEAFAQWGNPGWVRVDTEGGNGTVIARNGLFLHVAFNITAQGLIDASGCEFQETMSTVTITSHREGESSSLRECSFSDLETGVRLGAGVDATVEGCAFSHCGVGVHLQASDGATVSNCTFISCGVGIVGALDRGTLLEDLRVLDCHHGLNMSGSTGLEIVGVQVKRSTGHGIRLRDVRGAIDSTMVEGAGTGALVVDTSRLQVTGSQLSGSTRAGLMSNASYIDCVKCIVIDTSGTNVWVSFGRVHLNDSYVSAATVFEVIARDGASVLAYNTTLRAAALSVSDTAVVEVWWQLRVRVVVVDTRVPPVPAHVRVLTWGEATVLSEDTDAQGRTSWTWAMQLQAKAAGATMFTPHTVQTSLLGSGFTSELELKGRLDYVVVIPLQLVAVVTLVGAQPPVHEGEEVTLVGDASQGFPYQIVSWEWDVDYDGTFGADHSGLQLLTTFGSDGMHTIALRVTNSYGDVALTVTDLDVRDRSPTVTFVGAVPSGALEDEEVAYEVRYESPADDVVLIEWDFGDGSTALGTRAAHAWDEAGTYLVTVTVLDEDGSTASVSIDVTVANAVPVAVVPAGPVHARKGVDVLLDGSLSHDTASDNGTLLHTWDLGGGRTKLGALVYHAFPRAGEFTVTLTVTDRDGASSTATLRVVVSNEPPKLLPLPDVKLREDDPPWEALLGSFLSDPDDEVANLTVSATVAGGSAVSVKVEWNITRGWVVTVTPERHGSARVLVTVTDVDLGSAVTDFNVTVSPAPSSVLYDLGKGWWVALLVLAVIVGVVVALVVFRVWRRART